MAACAKTFLAAAFAAFAYAAFCAPADEDVGGTVMPYGSGETPEEIAASLVKVRAKSGISNFTLSGPGHGVRLSGILDVTGYATLGRKIGAVRAKLVGKGIKIGYKMLPTTNCGIRHQFMKFTFADGAVREFTACSGDENFRKDFAAKCAAVAKEARPFVLLVDDDFRYYGDGCFCENHVRRFAKAVGVAPNRKAVAAAINPKDEVGRRNRADWHRMQVGDLLLLAKAASDAVYAVSPETRVGICAPGKFPERDTAHIALVLAGGRHRPIIRWWGSAYGCDNPVEMPSILFSAQWAKENLTPEIECLFEADPCPNSRFFASAARMGATISLTLASGYSAPLFNALGDRKTLDNGRADHVNFHLRNLHRFAAIKAEGAKGRLVGVQTFFDARTRSTGGVSWARPFEPDAWYKALGRLGIPMTTAESPVKLACGYQAFSAMDAAAVRKFLSGNVILDGAAAIALQESGFGELIGVKIEKRDRIDFNHEAYGAFYNDGLWQGTSFHQNYGLDNGPVARLKLMPGAKYAASYGKDGKYQPSISWFENSLGGRVAVTALHMAGCKTASIFSDWKRDLFVKFFRKMGGERVVPARILDRGNMMLLANDDGKRLFLHATNISCDGADSVELEVVPPYSGTKVEILWADGTWHKADAKWHGTRLVVRPPEPLQVYGFMDLRLKGN